MILLMFLILFPLYMTLGTNNPIIIVLIILFWTPFQIISILRIINRYNKQRASFPVESSQIISFLEKNSELNQYRIKTIKISNPFIKRFLFHYKIIIAENILDIQVLLKDRKITTSVNGKIQKELSTLVFIGPITPSRREYIESLKSILENKLGSISR